MTPRSQHKVKPLRKCFLDTLLCTKVNDVLAVPASLAGLPAISVPAEKDESSLPFGLQLIAKPFDELTLLNGAKFIEESRKNE